MQTFTEQLPLAGWHRRDEYLDANPHLRVLMPNKTSLAWALRRHRRELAPFVATLGRSTLIHDAAAPKFIELLLRQDEETA